LRSVTHYASRTFDSLDRMRGWNWHND
jgi:hypothetical protein